MKVAVKTLGCKVNSYESEAVLELLKLKGYEAVTFQEFADIYIINTCMVTNTAEAKSRQIIHQPLKINPEAIIIVMGCLTQLKAEEILMMDGVKIVLGTSRRNEISDFIDEFLKFRKPLNKTTILSPIESYDNLTIKDSLTHQRAFLKIQDGCNNFCTYCIIPYTRGRVRSKRKEAIIDEANALVQKGHYEIILTGIHTGGYGSDLEDYSFASLLRDLENVEGLKRIRISSIEISELDEEVVDVIAQSKKIVNHLHIPLQGGTNRILKLMNRKYTIEEYYEKILSLRQRIPSLAITTDIIIGFPTETDSEHEKTLAFVEKCQFSELHVFPYSKRTGTVASKMKEEVPGTIKKERVKTMLALSNQLAKVFILQELNKVLEVIPEYKKDGYLEGHTANYLKIKFEGESHLIGEIVRVKIIEEKYPLSIAKIIE